MSMSTMETAAAPTGLVEAPLEANDDQKPSVREVELENELKVARTRIATLEQQVQSLQAELSLKRKAEASSSVPASSKKAKIAPVTPAAAPKLVSKRLQQTIKNSLKGQKFYNGYDATDRSINVNDVLSLPEFEAVFGNYGTLLQPTPSNKPKSTVYIKTLSAEDMQAILGGVESFKAELWTKGGVPTYRSSFGFFGGGGGGGGFSKGHKIKGGCQVILRHAEAKYSSNNGKLLLKCTFSNKKMFNEVDSDDGYGDY